jgi:hypothetical protein
MQTGIEKEIREVVNKNADRFQTVTSIQKELKKKKINAHWLTIRALLLGLVANGQIFGEQVADNSWIFRAKQQGAIAATTEAAIRT